MLVKDDLFVILFLSSFINALQGLQRFTVHFGTQVYTAKFMPDIPVYRTKYSYPVGKPIIRLLTDK